MTEAIVGDACFYEADLTAADLRYTNFSWSDTTNAKLDGVIWSEPMQGETYVPFGEWLRAQRESRGMSPEGLATQIGCGLSGYDITAKALSTSSARKPNLSLLYAYPITKMDVDGLIAADSDLAWSTSDYVDMADESGESTRYDMIMWRGKSCFWWYRDQILCSGPDDEQVLKLVEISRKLNAFVVGDDGEIYSLDQPSPSSTTGKRKPWWKFW